MIKILIITKILLLSINLFGQFQTIDSGNWDTGSNWFNNNIPPTNGGNNITVTINENNTIFLDGNLNPNNNFTLNIYGHLEINGDLIVRNNMIINVYEGGTLIVDGDFITQNNSNFTINGEISVTGDIEVGNGANLDGSGTIYVGGNHNLPTDSDINIIDGSLPIELLFFEAKRIGDYVVLSWSTATEINNDYFTLYRSTDGFDWEIIGNIMGAGNSNHKIDYEHIDYNPYTSITYYKLEQTDFDGTTESFRYAVIDGVKIDYIKIYNIGRSTVVESSKDFDYMLISDIYGRLLIKDNFNGNANFITSSQVIVVTLYNGMERVSKKYVNSR